MKIQLSSINFYDDISPQEEIIDSMDNSTKLIPIGKSGIHIKKKNRGSFTSYCGGKVTDECIRKAKNSPSAAIRKKATFADNARHWAKKHQQGGNIDLNELFVSPDTPPKFESNVPFNNYEDFNFTFDSSSYVTSKEKKSIAKPNDEFSYKVAEWLNTPREISMPLVNPSLTPKTNNSNLMSFINPHLGKPYKIGNYDCSNFASRVIKDMGYDLYGNCRTLWNGTSRINIPDLKPKDLIFLYDTQPADKVPHGLPTHVAIVTNTDRLKDGFVEVAHSGRTGGVSHIETWNLNKGFYKDHLLGAGRLIEKGKNGMKFFQSGGALPFIGVSDVFKDKDIAPSFERDYYLLQDFDEPLNYSNEEVSEETSSDYEVPGFLNNPRSKSSIESAETKDTSKKEEKTYSGKGYETFSSYWNEYEKNHPEASKYKKLLTAIALHESNFNHSILNTAGAPAYGYFQFWEDGKTNNITKYSGLSVDDFRNNPMAQIDAAVKLAKSFENQFNSEDLRIAKAQGYNTNQLIRGAWLGGIGGVRKVLRGLGNPTDSKWYKNGKGRSVKQAMDEQI